MRDCRIFIATHKEYRMPQGEFYVPVWAGAAINSAFSGQYQGDNEGDNISEKNPCFNELTVLYWAWKHSNAEIKGLAHYRRFLRLCPDDLYGFVPGTVIVPRKRFFYWMTVQSHYENSYAEYKSFLREDFVQLRLAILTLYPEYISAFDRCMSRHSAHMLNMFIAERFFFDSYCMWLFDIMFELEKHIPQYRSDQTRVCGALSEMLLDVYIEHNGYSIKERPLLELERQSLSSKIISRLKRMI